jgi:hypothetical protein
MESCPQQTQKHEAVKVHLQREQSHRKQCDYPQKAHKCPGKAGNKNLVWAGLQHGISVNL